MADLINGKWNKSKSPSKQKQGGSKWKKSTKKQPKDDQTDNDDDYLKVPEDKKKWKKKLSNRVNVLDFGGSSKKKANISDDQS